MKLSVIIAVYNEAATVGTLLERVWAQPVLSAGKGSLLRPVRA
jgi:hypothetical protein